jgi:hypothetical protein
MAWIAKSVFAAAAVGGVVWATLPDPPPKYLGDGDPIVRQQLPPMDTSAEIGHTPLPPPARPAAEGPGPVAAVAPSGPLVWVAPPLGGYTPSTPNTGVTLPMEPGIGSATNDRLPGTPGFPELPQTQLLPLCDLACLAAEVPPEVPPVIPPVILNVPLPIPIPSP